MVIGLDIGGTKITGVLLNGKRVIRELTIVTPKNLPEFKHNLRKLLEFLSIGKKITSLGVGIPGAVDSLGKVAYAPNLQWLAGFNLNKYLKSLKFKRVAVENDANCFALAESIFGQGRKYNTFIGITLGTGIGGGLIINKQLYTGARGSAGEVGHTLADAHRDFESWFKHFRNKKNYSALGRLLGRLLGNTYNLLDPEIIILGGSVAKFFPKFLTLAEREAKRHILNKNIKAKIMISKLKHAGALGAALLLK